MWQVFKMSIRQMDLLSHVDTRSGQLFLHTPQEGSRRVGRVTLMSCNECGSQERSDRLCFYDPQRHILVAIFLLYWWVFSLLAFLLWEVSF